jgi:molybdenum cofactor biosynthesis enzyme MoaA
MNYYELEPENNHFHDVIIDVTHQCNMNCKNCYIPNRDIPDMDIDKMLDAIAKFPKRCNIRIIGAEPTVRNDLPEICSAIKASGHRQILLTNGLRLGNNNYAKKLRASGCNHVYLSLNGVDNDDWYEEIDELRCAQRKLQALDNLQKNKFIIQTGTIIVQGVNENAPERLLATLKRYDVHNAVIRIKNVGQLGRHMNGVEDNIKMEGLMQLCSDQMNVSMDYLREWRKKPIVDTLDPELNSFMFPLDPASADKPINRSGIWVKIANWDTENEEQIPSPNSERRGRLTEDFKVAPFFEHVKMNEGGY